MENILNQKGYGGAVLMDLSKFFHTVNQDHLLAKLHAYDFDRAPLKALNSYLSNRYQRTKINKSFSSWSKIVFGVPQDSVIFLSFLISWKKVKRFSKIGKLFKLRTKETFNEKFY